MPKFIKPISLIAKEREWKRSLREVVEELYLKVYNRPGSPMENVAKELGIGLALLYKWMAASGFGAYDIRRSIVKKQEKVVNQ